MVQAKQGMVQAASQRSGAFIGSVRKVFFPALAGVFLLAQLLVAVEPLAAQEQFDPGGYRLGTGDKIRLIVFGEQDLGGEYVVDSSGYVRLPLIGQVQAAQMSLRQFESAVEARLKDGYLKDPKVSVEVTNYRPFYIIGEVNSPGQYPYVNGMTVLNAVALAGGFTYRAKTSRVYIRRNSKDGDEIDAEQSAAVQPGDIIRVAERFF
jgi:polysaccharide export outer membrane protein